MPNTCQVFFSLLIAFREMSQSRCGPTLFLYSQPIRLFLTDAGHPGHLGSSAVSFPKASSLQGFAKSCIRQEGSGKKKPQKTLVNDRKSGEKNTFITFFNSTPLSSLSVLRIICLLATFTRSLYLLLRCLQGISQCLGGNLMPCRSAIFFSSLRFLRHHATDGVRIKMQRRAWLRRNLSHFRRKVQPDPQHQKIIMWSWCIARIIKFPSRNAGILAKQMSPPSAH